MSYNFYQCDVCNKHTKKLIDNLRPFVAGCTITENCRGTLRPVMKHQMDGVELSRDTWKSRFESEAAVPSVATNERHNLMSGAQIITILSSVDVPLLELRFEKHTHTESDTIEYVFRRDKDPGYVSGPDDSALNRILRYTSGDSVTVAVNGVALTAGSYDLSIPNSVGLAPGVIANNSEIKIYVAKTVAPTYTSLPFFRNTIVDAKLLTGAWKNISFVDRGGVRLRVYHAIAFDELELNSNYKFNALRVNGAAINGESYFALGVKPYSSFDRNYNSVVRIDSNLSTAVIKYEMNDKNELELSIDNSYISSVFPPFSLSASDLDSSFFIPDDTIGYASVGNENQEIKNQFLR